MDRIERWIKRQIAYAVRGGLGQWVDSQESSLGKPIYRVTNGPVTLVLSQMGFIYDGVSPHFECRYDEVEALNLATLPELMRGMYHEPRVLTIGVILWGVSTRHDLQLPTRVYCDVATLLARIVRSPPGTRPGDNGRLI